ncbi:MAG: hypothetical protein ACRD3N_17000 [Terracidiphilus sp.]
MDIDLRIPMGMMFTLIGAVLMAFGLSTRSNAALYAPSMGIDVNLWWGAVLMLFGLILVPLGRRGQLKIEKSKEQGTGGGERRIEGRIEGKVQR